MGNCPRAVFPKLGRDPKVGHEALPSGSTEFFWKYLFLRHLLVSSNNSCFKKHIN